MAIRSTEELLSTLKDRIGEDTSDEALSFIEDVKDTMDDFNEKLTDKTDWKSKYEENDKAWRDKYKARFFSNEPIETNKEPEEEERKTLTFEELFK